MRRRYARLVFVGAFAMASTVMASTAWAQSGPRRGRPGPRRPAPADVTPGERNDGVEEVDRVVIRWTSRATGGVKRPQFITARELAFEARIESIVEGGRRGRGAPYLDKHVRSAMERRIAETMLARLPVDPAPSPRQVAIYAESARRLLVQRIGDEGAQLLDEARRGEGMTREELDAILRRRARASWYLDQTVAPMLRPSELDLREVHQRGQTPFTDRPFDEVADALRQWYVASRLATALDRYFRGVRSKVQITLIERPEASVRRPRRRRRRDTVAIPRPAPRRFARWGR